LSGFLIPPLAVLLFGTLLAFFVRGLSLPVNAESLPASSSTFTAASPSGFAPIFRPEVHYWSDSIIRWADASGLDPNLAAVVMQIESCGDPRATSSAGAMGLFQVMPYHFAAGENPYHPDTNALRGLNYLKRSLEAAGGDARLALAGYNGGIGVISRAEMTWAGETLRYIRYGFPIYEDARRGVDRSAALDEWYNRYGASLCRQAAGRLGLP
jgi:soluble lytic murein transglycosylase-like protein